MCTWLGFSWVARTLGLLDYIVVALEPRVRKVVCVLHEIKFIALQLRSFWALRCLMLCSRVSESPFLRPRHVSSCLFFVLSGISIMTRPLYVPKLFHGFEKHVQL